MLMGTAIGGAIAVLLFSFLHNVLIFTIAAVGLTIGVIVGSNMDRKSMGSGKS